MIILIVPVALYFYSAFPWTPEPGVTWQLQLAGIPVDTRIGAEIFDIDLFDNSKEVVDKLRSTDKKVICYISAGSFEDWRPDAAEFPKNVIGKDYSGWEGEKWLDIRQIDLLGPIMEKRLDLAKEKGCDAVDPDNVDGYTNDTGFPITYEAQLKYNIWLAHEAHERGLSIGLKNDPEQARDLVKYFDWILTEDCAVDGWCEQVEIFVKNGKAVLQVEYTDQKIDFTKVCEESKRNQFSPILKNRELDARIQTCF